MGETGDASLETGTNLAHACSAGLALAICTLQVVVSTHEGPYYRRYRERTLEMGLDRKVVQVGPACRAGHGVIQDATRGLELQPEPVCLLLDRITIKTLEVFILSQSCARW